MKKLVSIILAVDEKNWIGKNSDLAWRIKADMKYFKDITTTVEDTNKHNAVIMGRKTWDSIPEKFRPLPGRENVIITRNVNPSLNELQFSSLEEAVGYLQKDTTIESIFIIWGAQIYNDAIKKKLVDKVYITKVFWDFSCDVFFNGLDDSFSLKTASENFEENWIKFCFEVYTKK